MRVFSNSDIKDIVFIKNILFSRSKKPTLSRTITKDVTYLYGLGGDIELVELNYHINHNGKLFFFNFLISKDIS